LLKLLSIALLAISYYSVTFHWFQKSFTKASTGRHASLSKDISIRSHRQNTQCYEVWTTPVVCCWESEMFACGQFARN